MILAKWRSFSSSSRVHSVFLTLGSSHSYLRVHYTAHNASYANNTAHPGCSIRLYITQAVVPRLCETFISAKRRVLPSGFALLGRFLYQEGGNTAPVVEAIFHDRRLEYFIFAIPPHSTLDENPHHLLL